MDELDSIVEFSVNLKDQDQPDPLPVGKYSGVIRGAEVKMSQRDTKYACLLYTSPSPRDRTRSRMPSSA